MHLRWSCALGRCALSTSFLLVNPGPAASSQNPLDGWRRDTVERAREGAAARLRQPACQALLDDFHDAEGRTLRQNLETWDLRADAYIEMLPLVDGSGKERCRRSSVQFLTVPNLPRVWVCGPFPALQVREPDLAEWMLIHEMLHTLGLGENPPSSQDITRRVSERCPE